MGTWPIHLNLTSQNVHLVYWTAQQRHTLLSDREIVLLYIYGT